MLQNCNNPDLEQKKRPVFRKRRSPAAAIPLLSRDKKAQGADIMAVLLEDIERPVIAKLPSAQLAEALAAVSSR